MGTFAPTGPSMIVQLTGNQQQRVELPSIEGDNPVLRLVATAYPTASAYANVLFGDSDVTINGTGMAIDLSARREQVVALTGAPSNMAIAMSGITQGGYTICITPGVLVG